MGTAGHGGNLAFRPGRHMLACFFSKPLPAQESTFAAEGRLGQLIPALLASPSSFYLPVPHPSSRFPSRKGGDRREEGNMCSLQRRQLLLMSMRSCGIPGLVFPRRDPEIKTKA